MATMSSSANENIAALVVPGPVAKIYLNLLIADGVVVDRSKYGLEYGRKWNARFLAQSCTIRKQRRNVTFVPYSKKQYVVGVG